MALTEGVLAGNTLTKADAGHFCTAAAWALAEVQEWKHWLGVFIIPEIRSSGAYKIPNPTILSG